jgi:hypothetical protein
MPQEHDDALRLFDGQVFTRTEASAAGVGRAKFERWRRLGLIRQLVRNAYVDAAVPDSIALRAAAVGKVTPPDVVICRRTAAWLHGIDVLAFQELTDLPPVETVRPPKRRSIRTSPGSGHSQALYAEDVVELHGLRVTSALATAIHLARHRPRPYGLSAMDAMAHAGLIQPAELRESLRKYPHHPGIRKARELAALVEPATESPGESWLRLRMIDAGFPAPVPQIEVTDGKHRFRIDMAFLQPLPRTANRHLGLEYDSDTWHSTAEQLEHDEWRRQRLSVLGWDLLSVRRSDVWGDDPAIERKVGARFGWAPELPRRW